MGNAIRFDSTIQISIILIFFHWGTITVIYWMTYKVLKSELKEERYKLIQGVMKFITYFRIVITSSVVSFVFYGILAWSSYDEEGLLREKGDKNASFWLIFIPILIPAIVATYRVINKHNKAITLNGAYSKK